MNNHSAIKWRPLWTTIWILGFLYLIVYIGEDQVFDTHYSAWILGAILLIFGLYYFLKTRVWQFLLAGVVFGTGYWHYEAAAHMDTVFSMLTFFVHLVAFLLVFVTAGPVINRAVKLETQARKLFRLAAETVTGAENGYTARPYGAGRVEFSLRDAIGLARYLAGKDLVTYSIGEKQVVYAFSMNISPLVDPDHNRTSTIVIDDAGNLSVQISRLDYSQYRKKLSFDQLCESFARLFMRFMEAYRDNNEKRIIEELKSA